MKNFFFGISVLTLLLVGCDGGVPDLAETDAGRSDVGRSDTMPGFVVQGTSVISGTLACPIPIASRANPKVGTVPSIGYRLLLVDSTWWTTTRCVEQFGYFPGQPPTPNASTDCSSPVNGFAKTSSDPWCCVNTAPFVPDPTKGTAATSAYMTVPWLECSGRVGDLTSINAPQDIAGKVALCSVDGVFMGWDCNTKI